MDIFWKQCCVVLAMVLFSCPVKAEPTKGNIVVFVSAPRPIIESHEASILPHRATYAISLNKSFDPDICDVKGTMTVQILDTEDVWTYEQHADMMVTDDEGNVDQVAITITSWESKDGLRYGFNSAVYKNDIEEQTTSGKALLATPQGEGIVTYEQPYEITLKLPIGTAFPIGHLRRQMQSAVKGDCVCSHTVFDGSSDTHDCVYVNTVITPSHKTPITFSDPVPFSKEHLWSMQMAIYNPNDPDGGPEPDYEISQKVLPHGIISNMDLNFGDFEARLTLTQLEFFNNNG